MCDCIKKWILPALIAFGFVFVYEIIVHGQWLQADYEATSYLWRTPEAMKELCHFGMLATLASMFVLLKVFKIGYQGNGIIEGVRFGALMGVIFGLSAFSVYVHMPISMELAGKWFAVEFVKYVGIGVIFAFTASKCPICSK
jgi:hypothetical protein